MSKPSAKMAAVMVLLGSGALAALLSLGFFGRIHPAFDAVSHFRLHLAALLAGAGVVLLATRFRREGLVAVVLAIASVTVTPGTYPNDLIQASAQAASNAEEEPSYRLLQFNARFDNPTPQAFLSLVGRIRPDIITMQEVSTAWTARLDALQAAYPHRVICEARGRIGGVAILSRRPFANGSEPRCFDGGDMAMAAVDLGGLPVNVASVHFQWPWPYGQARQVERLAGPLSELGDTAILAGDFNATRWSQTFRSLATSSRLADAGPVGPSWLPYELPDALRRPIGLGIDHVLLGTRIVKRALGVESFAGSDHLPVLFEFSVLPEPEQETATMDVALR